MKTATKRAEQLKSLFKKALKEHKPQPLETLEPLTALVKAALAFDVSDDRAEDALAAIQREYCDLNELRVATDLEIQDLIGARYPAGDLRAAIITQGLNAIFEREHTLNLDRLKAAKKAEARQFLRDLPAMVPFVEAYTMLYGFGANTIPIDQTMATYLIEKDIFDPDTSIEDIQKFCEHHVKAEDSYDFFAALRAASQSKKKGK
jgi:endonuclease III